MTGEGGIFPFATQAENVFLLLCRGFITFANERLMPKTTDMNISRLFVFVAFFLFSVGAFAQSGTMILTYEDFVQLRQNRPVGSRSLHVAEVSGSPYLNKTYQLGSVLTRQGVKYVQIPLRYNVYRDEMEFRDAQGKALVITSPENLKEVDMGDTVFVYRPYRSEKKLRKGFFRLVNRGWAQGLIRYRTGFQPAQPAGAYSDPQPPKFVPYPPQFYVSVSRQPAVEVHKTKALIELLGDHKKEMQAFAKKNKIKLRRQSDLKRLLDYYNALKK